MKDFVEAKGKTQNEFCKIRLHVNKIRHTLNIFK